MKRKVKKKTLASTIRNLLSFPLFKLYSNAIFLLCSPCFIGLSFNMMGLNWNTLFVLFYKHSMNHVLSFEISNELIRLSLRWVCADIKLDKSCSDNIDILFLILYRCIRCSDDNLIPKVTIILLLRMGCFLIQRFRCKDGHYSGHGGRRTKLGEGLGTESVPGETPYLLIKLVFLKGKSETNKFFISIDIH